MSDTQKTILEKALVVLPHWVEHNSHHVKEYVSWAVMLREEGQSAAAEDVDNAAELVTRANKLLELAEQKVRKSR